MNFSELLNKPCLESNPYQKLNLNWCTFDTFMSILTNYCPFIWSLIKRALAMTTLKSKEKNDRFYKFFWIFKLTMSGVESISKIIIILMHIQHSYEYIDQLFSVYMKHRRFCGFSKEEWSLFMASNTSSLMASWTRATNEEKKNKKFFLVNGKVLWTRLYVKIRWVRVSGLTTKIIYVCHSIVIRSDKIKRLKQDK